MIPKVVISALLLAGLVVLMLGVAGLRHQRRAEWQFGGQTGSGVGGRFNAKTASYRPCPLPHDGNSQSRPGTERFVKIESESLILYLYVEGSVVGVDLNSYLSNPGVPGHIC